MSRVIASAGAPVVFRVQGADGHVFAGWATGRCVAGFDEVSIDASAFPGLDGALCFASGRLPAGAADEDEVMTSLICYGSAVLSGWATTIVRAGHVD